MNRICEPELMLEPIQARAYAEADFNGSDRAFTASILTLLATPAATQAKRPPPRIVDLGCGPGNISFRLAQRYPSASVLGIDGAAAMLDLARQALGAQPGLQERLRFEQHCLPDPHLKGGFTAVLSNSLLHHLHDPAVLWRTVRQLGASGACVYIKDLRRPPSPEAVLALQQRYLADAPPVLHHDYIASLHAAFSPDEVRAQLEAAGLAQQLQVGALDDRYLEVWGRLL